MNGNLRLWSKPRSSRARISGAPRAYCSEPFPSAPAVPLLSFLSGARLQDTDMTLMIARGEAEKRYILCRQYIDLLDAFGEQSNGRRCSLRRSSREPVRQVRSIFRRSLPPPCSTGFALQNDGGTAITASLVQGCSISSLSTVSIASIEATGTSITSARSDCLN